MSRGSGLAGWVQVWHWPWQPAVVLAVAALGWLYAAGLTRTAGTVTMRLRLRVMSFYSSLAVALIALESPAQVLASTSFAWNLTQEMLLLLAVPPLAVAAAPWSALRAGLPSRRLRYGIFPLRQRWARLARRWRPLRLLGHPRSALIVFAGYLWVMHMPAVFDLALRLPLARGAVYLGYVAVGLWFWSRLIESPPLLKLPSYWSRIELIAGGLLSCWVLAAALMLASTRLYQPYLHVPGATPHHVLASLQAAGAIMWGPAMLPFDVILTITVSSWLTHNAQAGSLSGTGPAGRGAL